MADNRMVITPAVTEILPFEHVPPFNGWKDFKDKVMAFFMTTEMQDDSRGFTV